MCRYVPYIVRWPCQGTKKIVRVLTILASQFCHGKLSASPTSNSNNSIIITSHLHLQLPTVNISTSLTANTAIIIITLPLHLQIDGKALCLPYY
jgi:hypothetical protein